MKSFQDSKAQKWLKRTTPHINTFFILAVQALYEQTRFLMSCFAAPGHCTRIKAFQLDEAQIKKNWATRKTFWACTYRGKRRWSRSRVKSRLLQRTCMVQHAASVSLFVLVVAKVKSESWNSWNSLACCLPLWKYWWYYCTCCVPSSKERYLQVCLQMLHECPAWMASN